MCNTNDKEAFKPADCENSSGHKQGFGRGRGGPGQRGRCGGQGQRGHGATGRPAAHPSHTSFGDKDGIESFDDSDEEALGLLLSLFVMSLDTPSSCILLFQLLTSIDLVPIMKFTCLTVHALPSPAVCSASLTV